MRTRFLLFLAFVSLMSGFARSQTVISELYFPQVSNGTIPNSSFVYTTQVAITHTGGESRIVMIQFLNDYGNELPITTLTFNEIPGATQNCGIGCYAYTMGPGGYNSIFAETEGVGTTLINGYAKVTILSPDSSAGDPSVAVAMALNAGGTIVNEPPSTNPDTLFGNPFSESASVLNGFIAINPQTTVASVICTIYDNAEPPNPISTRMMGFQGGAHYAKFLTELFGSDLVESGSYSFESDIPIFLWPIKYDSGNLVFLNPPDQRTPEQKTEDLIDDVGELIDVELNPGQANGLQSVLNNVLRSIEKGKIQPACSQLQGFINQVIGKTPPLSQATSNELIAGAMDIRAGLSCSK